MTPDLAFFAGLILIVYLGEAGVPMLAPVELALIAAGARFAPDLGILMVVAAMVVAADVLGTLSLYALVRASMRGRRLPALWRRMVGSATSWAARLGAARPRRIVVGRTVPFLRVPTAGAAALAGLSARRYATCALAGGAIWTALFLGGGALVARSPW